MELLKFVVEQVSSNRLPLVAITVASVACPDTPVIVTLHWHGFMREPAQGKTLTLAPVASTSLQINERWAELAELEIATMEAGWELGAWDVVRAERPSCRRPGAPEREAIECLNAFGKCAMPYHGSDLVISDAPDAGDLVELAASSGYFCWQFRPVFGGLWSGVNDDATLNADGTRDPQCPLTPLPAQGEGSHRTVYRFGEAMR